ncbi:MAG: glycosyltransferase family 2 protein, partial [candidate division Zixibacteria bacterium]|nr:glycosyltransferase family 2 protein [candidate division Zixibacteria bacterium]
MKISIIIPVYNQLEYTKICLDSIKNSGGNPEIIIIDNASTDGTKGYLTGCTDIRVITNQENFGCARAWNQGLKAASGKWIIFLNNDVIVSLNWIEGLLEFAEQKQLAVVSPAVREGEYNYDMRQYSHEFTEQMKGMSRMKVGDGICFMANRKVFDMIGLFDENFKIGQLEDTDFLRRVRLAGLKMGITGRSFIHHFGSITQNAIRRNRPGNNYEHANRNYYYQKWKLWWYKR